MNLNSILKIKVPERNESEFKPLKAMHCKAHIQIHDQPNVHQKDQANIKIWEQPEHRHRMWYLNLDSSLPMWAPSWEAYIWIQTSPRIVGNHTTTEVKSGFKPLWNQVSFRSHKGIWNCHWWYELLKSTTILPKWWWTIPRNISTKIANQQVVSLYPSGKHRTTGWWFGTFFIFPSGIVVPTDELHHFSEG